MVMYCDTATRKKAYEEAGYLVMPAACTADEIAPLRAEVDAAHSELEKGGYRIWSPVTELPPALKLWSETRGKALVSQVLSPGKKLKCIGGAAILKTPGDFQVGTPFHQDEAFKKIEMSKNKCALWLALSEADARSGCLRFVPSLGYDILPHVRVAREEAPSGFENFLTPGSEADAKAERHFVSVPVEPGDALIIGRQVVHGSHSAIEGERIAFSPLYEWD